MALVFQDNFSLGTDNVDIVGNTPDVAGTDWLSLFNDSGIGNVIWSLPAGDNASSSLDETDVGILLHANYGTVGSASLDAELGFANKRNEVDKITFIVARYIDSNNFIAVNISAHSSQKVRLYKVVAGTTTLLGTSTNTPSAGDTIKLQLRGSTWKVFFGAVEEISITEAALALRGKTGFGAGDIHNHFSGADIHRVNVWSQAIVTEIIFNELVGDIGQLVGNMVGVLIPEGTLVGDIGQLVGVINGVAIIGGPLNGDIGQLVGNIIGNVKLFVGTLDGDIGQLTANLDGLVEVSGALIGDIVQLNGNIIGDVEVTGALIGIINQLSGSILGFDVHTDSVTLSLDPSEISDFRLTWFRVAPTPGVWTFKPIIKPS